MAKQLVEYTRLEKGRVVEALLIDPEVHNQVFDRYPNEVTEWHRDVIELRRGRNGYRALKLSQEVNSNGELVPSILLLKDSTNKFGQDTKLVDAFSGDRLSEATLDNPLRRFINLRTGNGSRFRLATVVESSSTPEVQ